MFNRLLEYGADVSQVNDNLDSALHIAALHRNTNMLRLLMLQIGVQVDIRNKNGDTPLMIACTANDLETSHFLIDSGAEVNVANSTGNFNLD